MKNPSLSVIGLGKLGSPMVGVFASKGFKVIGVDKNQNFVDKINSYEAPVYEPGLAELISKHRKNISATNDYNLAINSSNITFIIVPTPSTSNWSFSTEHVKKAIEEIGPALRAKKEFHLVVLTSTVLPRTSREEIIPLLQSVSKKKIGKKIGFCYNPEFIALGSVVTDLLNPNFVLIGESDKKSGAILESFYKKLYSGSKEIRRMDTMNAELTKVALNTFVTTKISFANTLTQLCELLPGGNIDVVASAIGLDNRVGSKYLKGGLGYGGPCFPRDNKALNYLAKKYGLSHGIAKATDYVNEQHLKFITQKLISHIPKNGTVAILGLSYKPSTNVIEESHGLKLAKALLNKGVPVTVYDPAAMTAAKPFLTKAKFADSIEECVHSKDVICITTPWDEFKQIKTSQFRNSKKTVLIDCWRILDPQKFKRVSRYIPLGVNQINEEN